MGEIYYFLGMCVWANRKLGIFSFILIFRKNSKVKLLEIRRILRVFPSEAQSTYKIVSNCLILLGKFWLVLTAKKYFFVSSTIKRSLKLHENPLDFADFGDFFRLKL